MTVHENEVYVEPEATPPLEVHDDSQDDTSALSSVYFLPFLSSLCRRVHPKDENERTLRSTASVDTFPTCNSCSCHQQGSGNMSGGVIHL